jgi:DNA-binding transcriptional MocR family regulator
MDQHGLLPAAFEAACAGGAARVLYVTPTNHNPCTTVMPAARRREIVRIARKHDVTIIENAALAPLVKDAPPPLAALAPERTIHLSSLSKSVLPALRTGFIRAPLQYRASIENGVTATAWSASPLLAEIAARWIRDGIADVIRDSRRAEAAARFGIARAALAGRDYQGSPAGYFVWLVLPPRVDAIDLVRRAEERHVLVGPAHLFAADREEIPNAIRISLGAAATRDDLSRGLATLNSLIDGTD